ncbi:D-hexose-6-phosphate mutarotase [Janthinobacterium sp. 17J80-10]|uniref:aldose epimerase family protein n=1 Tax=Janthinobacterium sp. 17J80-10 TaxID=2497863 RepID=UPI0010058ACE|nr:D-hexose-6-phosphate mutarotase [Janthinobacterium sp. 17J80-10]QAU36150.1 D-hexose-6-phosphate mutarotase [Janthinobacterium sp. 17J80-10]
MTHQALGAQLLGAELPLHGAVFYLSPLATDAFAPARGGVPVLFPQFADTGSLRKHGYVRDLPWTLGECRNEAGVATVCYALEISDGDIEAWPHGARLQMKAALLPDRLTIELGIENIGTSAFTFTGGLHPYFFVQDLRHMRISGLQGVKVHDRYQPLLAVEEAQALALDAAPFERLYDGCPDLTLWTGEKQLTLSASGFDQWMVWNPGETGARQLADLPDADWQRFVCIEPVRVARPVCLAPGETFSGTLTIT